MKQTVIQCLTAIVCVIAICVTSVIGIGNISKAKVEAVNKSASASVNDNSNQEADPETPSAEVSDTDTTEPDSTDAAGDVVSQPADGTSDTASTNSTTTANGNNSTTKNNASKVPSTKDDIAAYYNTAINKVISSKAGYTKSRTTTLSNLNGGALLKMQIVVDTVNDFLGVGTKEYKNTKGKAEFLSTASIKASDINSASCTNNGGVYTITINLKDGTNSASASGASDTTALGRSGMFAGKGDKVAFDYKNSSNIYTGINNVEEASVEKVSENVTKAKIVAKVNESTGKITSLAISYNWSVNLTNVKYLIVTIKSASGDAVTSVSVSNFQW